ncbi:hypothetical protein [Pengzhenrongella phosphoraccumulans]|uniref:hypothetical protein n=1 Tax=Pengzhenrongella phosphoraccumulans TaxID=3114394 RepID=UPI0038901979
MLGFAISCGPDRSATSVAELVPDPGESGAAAAGVDDMSGDREVEAVNLVMVEVAEQDAVAR